MEIDRNNSSLEDKGLANQNLTTADIELLKAQGKTGDEIVAALTQNSATFQQKTQFSQVASQLQIPSFPWANSLQASCCESAISA